MIMCVAYPMKVTAVKDDMATVALGDTQAEVSLELLDGVAEGEYVIVHAGFAIQKLSVADAEEALRLLAELDAAERDPP
jgi:hydrogenase expression/formation protein HypC